MLPFIFSSLLDHSLWIKYNVQWNVNVVIKEATREYIYRTDKCLTEDRSCLKTLWGLSQCLCKNKNIWVLEKVQLNFLRNIWQANNFFCISFVSHGIALAKHMVKQGEVVFFTSKKNLNDRAILKISGRIQG